MPPLRMPPRCSPLPHWNFRLIQIWYLSSTMRVLLWQPHLFRTWPLQIWYLSSTMRVLPWQPHLFRTRPSVANCSTRGPSGCHSTCGSPCVKRELPLWRMRQGRMAHVCHTSHANGAYAMEQARSRGGTLLPLYVIFHAPRALISLCLRCMHQSCAQEELPHGFDLLHMHQNSGKLINNSPT